MKVCHMEAMKEIRNLEQEKEMLIENEERRNTVSYKEGEEPVDTGYSYGDTRKRIALLDTRVREIKGALARANCTVRLAGFDVTIGEGLVLLAQWNAELDRLTEMSYMQQITRRITQNGTLEYTECLFDVVRVEEECRELKRKIGALQVAIDRANVISEIEI